MQTFKEYITTKDPEEYPVLDTHFGAHSEETPVLDTVFGAHSKDTKKVEEDSQTHIDPHKKNYSEDNALSAVHYDLVDHHHKYTDKDKKAITHYTTNSAAINRHARMLHAGGRLGEDESALAGHDDMHKVISRHKLPHDVEVWSGTTRSPEHATKSKIGAITSTSHFTSTSLSKDRAYNFAGHDLKSKHNKIHAARSKELEYSPSHMMHIKVPKGHPAAYVDHLSVHRNEKELILGPGTKMRHLGTSYDADKHMIIHHHEVIP